MDLSNALEISTSVLTGLQMCGKKIFFKKIIVKMTFNIKAP